MDQEDSAELDFVNSAFLGDDSDLTSLAFLCYVGSAKNRLSWRN